MAKKTKEENIDDIDIDIPEMDDIDFGELEDIDNSRETSKLGIAKSLAKETTAGFLDSVIKETAKKTLPEEYSYNYQEALDYVDFGKEVFERNKNKINKSVYALGKQVKKILPFQLNILNKFLEKYESDFEQFKTQTEEQIREASIQSNISSIFDKQLEVQKALEAIRSSEEKAKDNLNLGISKLNLDTLTSIDNNIANQTAFTLQISKEYYKKSLELQFKSYFIQVDMLKTMRDYYKGFSVQLDSIIKNTGLPEFVKLKNTERLQEIIRTELAQSTYKKLFNNSEYVDTIKKRISGMIDEKINSITDSIDQITSSLEMINDSGWGGAGLGMLSGIIANLGGGILGEKLANKIAPKLKDKIKDNKVINTGANYLSLLATSPSTFFSSMSEKVDKKVSEYEDESTSTRFLASKLFGGLKSVLDLTAPGRVSAEVKGTSILSHNQPAIFDNKVHRSITEVIPMYLSKILAENTNLRIMYNEVHKEQLSGFKQVDALVYDYNSRKLTTKEKFRSNIEKDLFSGKGMLHKADRLSSSLNSLASTELSKDKKANKENLRIINNKKIQSKFTNFLQEVAKDDSIDFSYKSLIGDYGTDKYNPKLQKILDNDPELQSYINILKSSKITSDKIDSTFKDVKRLYPIEGVKELFKVASKLVGSSSNRLLNIIDDDQANILSKALTAFIYNEGRDISISNILNGSAFKYLENKDYKKVESKLKIFIAQVKRINNLNDMLQISSLNLAIGSLNKSLKDGFELDPDIFKTLYDYSPILADKGKLSLENIVEGKLGKFEDKEYVDISSIKNLTRTKISDVKKLINVESSKDLKKNILDKTVSTFKDYTSIYKEAITSANKNPFQMIRNITKVTTDISNDIKQKVKNSYEKASSSIDKISSTIKNLSKEQTEKVIRSTLTELLSNINSTISNIDEILRKEEEAKTQQDSLYDKTKESISEVAEDKKSLRELEHNKKLLDKSYTAKIKTLNTLRKKLVDIGNSIPEQLSKEELNIISIMKDIKAKVTTLIDDVRKELENYEKALA